MSNPTREGDFEMLTFNEYTLEIELLEDLLGTIPKNPDVYKAYLDDKKRDAIPDPSALEPVDMELIKPPTPEELEEKGWTGFYVDDDGLPVMMDYQVKGFLKEAANTIKGILKLTALRSHLDNELFVFPRRQPLCTAKDLPLAYLERPLRAMTAQGPRVSVVRSDIIPAGTKTEWDIKVLSDSRVTQEVLENVIEYGALKGLGQWRNGGYGRFTGVLKPVE